MFYLVPPMVTVLLDTLRVTSLVPLAGDEADALEMALGERQAARPVSPTPSMEDARDNSLRLPR